MLKIKKVKRNSLAKSLGLEVGDEIVAFNGEPCQDELDVAYYSATDGFLLTVKNHRTGEETQVQVEKEEGEDLGLEFAQNGKIRTCHNRCVFCFVDQMPENMRESLYVKDDDYTMSFTCGNFVTLTNVTDQDMLRILRLRLSPLYISVHTMNKDLRVKLLKNRFAGKIVEQIDTLANHGIQMHCQAVLVPNENDGEELAYTARELFKYYPYVRDLACVPTGITKYRNGLAKIEDIDKAYSENLLDLIDRLNQEFGVRFLLPADEYFIKAERPIKDKEFYGDFSQIENGIGMATRFLSDAKLALETLCLQGKNRLKKAKKALLVCGVSAEKILKEFIKECNEKIENLHAVLLPVKNDFFGETVTCTGLLTGKDILSAVENYQKEQGKIDELVLDGNTMKEFEQVFLCGMTLKEMKKKLKIKTVRVNRDGGNGFVQILAAEKHRK
jgi:putative radical SAM enzyme (TIGR03279 family)